MVAVAAWRIVGRANGEWRTAGEESSVPCHDSKRVGHLAPKGQGPAEPLGGPSVRKGVQLKGVQLKGVQLQALSPCRLFFDAGNRTSALSLLVMYFNKLYLVVTTPCESPNASRAKSS